MSGVDVVRAEERQPEEARALPAGGQGFPPTQLARLFACRQTRHRQVCPLPCARCPATLLVSAEKLGLIKMETSDTVALRLAVSGPGGEGKES